MITNRRSRVTPWSKNTTQLEVDSRSKLMKALADHGFRKQMSEGWTNDMMADVNALPSGEKIVALEKIEGFVDEVIAERAALMISNDERLELMRTARRAHETISKSDAMEAKLQAAIRNHPARRDEILNLHDDIDEKEATLREKQDEFKALTGHSFEEHYAICKRLAADVPTPPLTSALNVEAALMGFPHFFGGIGHDALGPDAADGAEYAGALLSILDYKNDPLLQRVRRTFDELHRRLLVGGDQAGDYARFAYEWRRSSYARLEVSHKLAASLCLTDIPDDIAVHHPWGAWSLIVPDGLLGDIARVWLLASGERATIVLNRKGERIKPEGVTLDMMTSLVQGCALALSNPDEFRKERQHAPSARASSSKGRTSGAPDMNQARFLLSAPMKIDLREHVTRALSGAKRGGAPTVTFIVRGHWRQQAHGPARSLRKTIWIQPFYKGPEESRVLLRNAKVEFTEELISTPDPASRH